MTITVTIPAGEKLEIKFAETDGSFEVHYDTPEYKKQLVIKETAGLSATDIGEANEILYQEKYDEAPFELNREEA